MIEKLKTVRSSSEPKKVRRIPVSHAEKLVSQTDWHYTTKSVWRRLRD